MPFWSPCFLASSNLSPMWDSLLFWWRRFRGIVDLCSVHAAGIRSRRPIDLAMHGNSATLGCNVLERHCPRACNPFYGLKSENVSAVLEAEGTGVCRLESARVSYVEQSNACSRGRKKGLLIQAACNQASLETATPSAPLIIVDVICDCVSRNADLRRASLVPGRIAFQPCDA
jgi:hypothetical protein